MRLGRLGELEYEPFHRETRLPARLERGLQVLGAARQCARKKIQVQGGAQIQTGSHADGFEAAGLVKAVQILRGDVREYFGGRLAPYSPHQSFKRNDLSSADIDNRLKRNAELDIRAEPGARVSRANCKVSVLQFRVQVFPPQCLVSPGWLPNVYTRLEPAYGGGCPGSSETK
jgi:hypothetical protein